MHGDYRLDNMLFDPDRTRVTVVDWQTVGVGLPARDLAYFTSTSLDPDVRSQVEKDLVADYHRALSGYGVNGLRPRNLLARLPARRDSGAADHGAGMAFASSTERGDEMMLIMLSRGCQAVRELGALELVSSYDRPDPGGSLVDGRHRAHSRRQRRAVDHHHRQTQRGGGIELGSRHRHRRCSSSPARRCGVRAAAPARRRSGRDRATATARGAAASASGIGRGHRPDQKPRVDVAKAAMPDRPVVRNTRE